MALEGKLDVDDVIEQLLSARNLRPGTEIVLEQNVIRNICFKVREIFLSQPILLELEAPLNVIGDIHGQYYDLLRHFENGGFPPDVNYLFLGDYVDRGRQSIETICLLFAYKIKYPENFFLLRGNHECESITRIYGFHDECKRRYNVKLWKSFIDCFNCIPLAAVIDEKIFCCHGGLSPSLQNLDQIRRISRPTNIPDQGLVCDIVWSDPEKDLIGWGDNERGVSFTFGSNIVRKFLDKNDLDLICRAHQVVEDGYEFFANRRLVTVFSAPNYCGEFDNAAAMLCIGEGLLCTFKILKPTDRRLVLMYQNSDKKKGNQKKKKKKGELANPVAEKGPKPKGILEIPVSAPSPWLQRNAIQLQDEDEEKENRNGRESKSNRSSVGKEDEEPQETKDDSRGSRQSIIDEEGMSGSKFPVSEDDAQSRFSQYTETDSRSDVSLRGSFFRQETGV